MYLPKIIELPSGKTKMQIFTFDAKIFAFNFCAIFLPICDSQGYSLIL